MATKRAQDSHSSECRCKHCGLGFHAKSAEDLFCCSGCEYVYRLIRDEDLDRYYDLRGKRGQPVTSTVFLKRNWNWLSGLADGLETTNGGLLEVKLSLAGISCVGCVWLIEKLFKEFEGGVSCSIDVQRGTIRIVWKDGVFDIVAFAGRLQQFGYELIPLKAEKRSETHEISWRIAVCGAFALNAMLFSLPQYLGMEQGFAFAPHFNWLSALFATGSIAFGGWFFIGRALIGLRKRFVHMDLPIALGVVVAYLISWYGFATKSDDLVYFDFVSTFIFLMLVGRWVHVYAIERNKNRLSDIEIESPQIEVVEDDGQGRMVTVEDLKVGDRYRVAAGSWVPVRSKLREFKACVGLDWINGESSARIFARGSEVVSGGINRGSDAIELLAEEIWSDSLMRRLLQSTPRDRAKDLLTGIWIARYLLVALNVACGAFAFWAFAGEFDFALRVLVSALVVSCPCALGVALPMADELAQSALKRAGVFINANTLWMRMSRVSKIVFDKTGTLTRSNLDWENTSVLAELDAESVEALSHLVSVSEHPVASSVREVLFAKGLFVESTGWHVLEVIGDGLEGRKGSVVWRLGRSEWAGKGEDPCTALTCDGKLIARLYFLDTTWPDAAREISCLRKQGKSIWILSGDSQDKVSRIAASLGVDGSTAIGDLQPQDKEQWIRNRGDDDVLMIGDGANDSLAFDASLASGTPAVVKSALAAKADFYYMGAGIAGVRKLLDISSRRRFAVRALMAFAVSYNVAALSFALCGSVTPLMAAIIMPISSLVSLAIVWSILGERIQGMK